MKEMIMSLIIIIGDFAYIQINKKLEVKRVEQQEKAKKIRELRSQMKLQAKRDEFEEFKKVIKSYPKEVEHVEEDVFCKFVEERDNTSYYKSYIENQDNKIRNLRITLQDFTVEEVMHLYSL